MLGIHEHRLNFSIIDELDKKNLIFLDKSTYMEQPDMPILEVTKPMFKQVFKIHIIPNQVNIINSINLGFDCDTTLPDGLYKLKYGVNPHTIVYKCIDYFKLSSLYEKIGNLLLTLDTCDLDSVTEIKNTIVDLYILTKAIPLNTLNGRTQLAVQQYRLADKMVDRLYTCNTNTDKSRKSCNVQ